MNGLLLSLLLIGRGPALPAQDKPRAAWYGHASPADLMAPLVLGMALVVPNAAEDVMLQNILNKTAPQNKTLKLFTNNITPAETDTAATYTEASGNGYAAISLSTPASWTITPGNPTTAAYPEQVFTFTGALGNVYGYYVVETVSGIIQWAERFPTAPYNIANNGDQIKITPQFTGE